jgi:flagellar hook protein FlgE
MTIKSILVAAALIISPQLHAGNLFKLTKEPLTINHCPIVVTQYPFDLALLNQGYFVVSHGKKDSELLFTRFGKLRFDSNFYLRTDSGDYLLGLTKKSDPKHLSKIKIPLKNLPPKATRKIEIEVNLPAMETQGIVYESLSTIYDSISKEHKLNIKFTRIGDNTWKARVFVGEVALDEGTLVFNTTGTLSKQEGLRHIQWSLDYGINELKIDFKDSTQFGAPFTIAHIDNDGYRVGVFQAASVTMDGEISLIYDNGVSRILKNHIAVAMFTNPGHLEYVISHLYRPSQKSGPPRIHWKNSEHSLCSGCLEDEPCLVN